MKTNKLRDLLRPDIKDWNKLEEFDFIKDMESTPQDPEWHSEGNVLVHTKMMCKELINILLKSSTSVSDRWYLNAAALFHDVEKRSTTIEEVIDGKIRITSPNHAKRGGFFVQSLLYKELNISLRGLIEVKELVRTHGKPLWILDKDDPEKEMRRLSLEVNLVNLYYLCKADILGRICKDQNELLFKLELFKELAISLDLFNSFNLGFKYPSTYDYFVRHKDFNPHYEPIKKRETVYLVCGLPGSGKDYYIKNLLKKDLPSISIDSVRESNNLSPIKKKDNGRAIQLTKGECKKLLRKKESFIFNSTCTSRELRSKWVKLFKEYSFNVEIKYIHTGYQTLLKRNSSRESPVPEKYINKLIDRLEIPYSYEADIVSLIQN